MHIETKTHSALKFRLKAAMLTCVAVEQTVLLSTFIDADLADNIETLHCNRHGCRFAKAWPMPGWTSSCQKRSKEHRQ